MGEGTQSSRAGYGRPDWVMLGVPNLDGTVSLFASTELSSSELEQVNHFDEAPDPSGFYMTARPRIRLDGRPDRTITLTVVMGNYVLVRAPDYATALQHLFATWKPERADRRAVAGRRSLGR